MAIIQELNIQNGFTSTERLLADYILDHAEEIVHLNIGVLAQNAFVSNPTIIRLCHKLGFSGYKDFRLNLVAEIEKNRFETTEVDMNYPFHETDDPTTVMKKIAVISQQAIDSCYASISPNLIEKAASMLVKANIIYIFAAGDTGISATGFANMLMKLGFKTVIANQYDESMAVTCNATDKDVAIIITYSGSRIQALKNELRVLRRTQCKTILISSAEPKQSFDLTILFPGKERRFGKTAGYYSQNAIRYIFNCIYGVIYLQDPLNNMHRKYRAETMSTQEGRVED